MCEENDSYLQLSAKFLKDFPRYLEETIKEEEKSEINLNGFGNQCFKDYLRIFTTIASERNKSWALQGKLKKINFVERCSNP